jgi:hypothetical protein
MVVNRKVGAAMVTALDRVNENPERLKERLREALLEIDRLRAQIERQRQTIAANHRLPDDEPDVQKILQIQGRAIGNQSALARALHVGPDRVSKWYKQGRLQVYTDASGIEWFFLDQVKPSRKRRGQ